MRQVPICPCERKEHVESLHDCFFWIFLDDMALVFPQLESFSMGYTKKSGLHASDFSSTGIIFNLSH